MDLFTQRLACCRDEKIFDVPVVFDYQHIKFGDKREAYISEKQYCLISLLSAPDE